MAVDHLSTEPVTVEVNGTAPAVVTAEPAPRVTVLEYRPTVRESLREAWRQRNLVGALGANVLMLSFKRTYIGPGWILIQVLMDTFGKAFIFGKLVQVRGPDGIPYFIFLIGGMLCWRMFQRTLYITTRGFDRFSRLTRELHFPLLLIPIAATAQLAFEFAIYMGLLLVAVAYYLIVHGHFYLSLGPRLALAPLGLAWALVFAWGLAMFTGPLNSRTRDVRHILRNVIPIWLYVTPIIYPLDRLHGTLRVLAQLNPMAPVVQLVQVGFFGDGVVSLRAAALSVVVTLGVFLGGVWFVSRHGPQLAGFGNERIADDYDDEDV